MTQLADLWMWRDYALVVIPSLVLMIGAGLVGFREREHLGRSGLWLLLLVTAAALALLGLLIWFNPFGRTISSSLAAWGMLPALVALLVLVIRRPGQIATLWKTDKALLVLFALAILGLLGFLWQAEHSTFYLVLGLSLALAIIWIFGAHLKPGLVLLVSLLSTGVLLLVAGGAFFTPGVDAPAWQVLVMQIAWGIALLLSLFLPAALIYSVLRGEGKLAWKSLIACLLLSVLLLGGSAYMVFWDGVWSSAHARAFEDHLPFNHFMVSLIAGVSLALTLRGWRRLAGPAYILLVIVVTTAAFVWGWRTSAFEITLSRAARVDAAIARFHQDYGRYPDQLAELTPRYLPLMLPPVDVRRGGWCYQGSTDSYRLGYVTGKFTYFKADFLAKVYSQAGPPPQGSWTCDDWVAKFQANNIPY